MLLYKTQKEGDNMKLKDKIYLKKVKYEMIKGALQGKIIPFDEEFYKSMSTTYFSCRPISMHIKYLKPIKSKDLFYNETSCKSVCKHRSNVCNYR